MKHTWDRRANRSKSSLGQSLLFLLIDRIESNYTIRQKKVLKLINKYPTRYDKKRLTAWKTRRPNSDMLKSLAMLTLRRTRDSGSGMKGTRLRGAVYHVIFFWRYHLTFFDLSFRISDLLVVVIFFKFIIINVSVLKVWHHFQVGQLFIMPR